MAWLSGDSFAHINKDTVRRASYCQTGTACRFTILVFNQPHSKTS